MKKRIVISLALAVLMAASAFAFAACSGKASGSATAFTLVHGHYVGRADITVKDGVIEELTLDEMQMPYNWAVITVGTGNILNADGKKIDSAGRAEGTDGFTTAVTYPTISFPSQTFNYMTSETHESFLAIPNVDEASVPGVMSDAQKELADLIKIDETDNKDDATKDYIQISTTVIAAKYIKIGDEVLKATATRGIYSNKKITDIEKFVKVDANGKWFWDKMAAGEYAVLKGDGTTVSTHAGFDFTKAAGDKTFTKGERWMKSKNGYWTVTKTDSNGGGWTGNMDTIQTFLKGKDVAVFDSKVQKDSDGKWWMIGDTKTGATLTDMYDYYLLAELAFRKV